MTEVAKVVLSCHCRAPRERVFQAFAEPHVLETWYAPGADWDVSVDFVDFRVGGHYHLHFGPPDESVRYTEDGLYLEIEEPLRLVFDATLFLEDRVVMTTRCRIDLREAHDGTEVHLTESGCPDDARAARRAGWQRTLDNLARHFARAAHAG